MDPEELARALEQLVQDARAHRAELAELSAKITTACERVSTIRSTLRGHESTPGTEDAQDQVDPVGEDAQAAT